MKTQKTTISKLIDRFDNELKTLLMNDLSLVKGNRANLVDTIQNTLNSRLKAA